MGQIQLTAMSTAKIEANQIAVAPGHGAVRVRSSAMASATSPVTAQAPMTTREVFGSVKRLESPWCLPPWW